MCILEPKWHKTQDAPTTKPPTNQTVGFSIRAVLCLARWGCDDADGEMFLTAKGLSRAVLPRDASLVGL